MSTNTAIILAIALVLVGIVVAYAYVASRPQLSPFGQLIRDVAPIAGLVAAL